MGDGLRVREEVLMCEFLSGLTFGPKLEKKYGRCYSNPKKAKAKRTRAKLWRRK